MPASASIDEAGDARPRTERLFFALYPDAAAKTRIADLARGLRAGLRLSGNPAGENRLHVTLQFLGSYRGLPHALLDAAMVAGSNVEAAAFDVAFDSVASFDGRGKRPLVLLGDGGLAPLRSLRRKLRAHLRAGGTTLAREPAYTPHVTLLYDDEMVRRAQVEAVAWRAREFMLVKSLVGRAEHVTLGRWPLHD